MTNHLVRAMFPLKPSASCSMIRFSTRIVSELPAAGNTFKAACHLWHAACSQETCERWMVSAALLTRVMGEIVRERYDHDG